MDANTACWECQHSEGSLAHLHARHSKHHMHSEDTLLLWLGACTGFLHTLTRIHNCTSLNSLLEQVIKNQSFPKDPIDIPFVTHVYWQVLELYLGLPVTSKYSVTPPNSIIVLLHSSVLRHVLSGTSFEQQEALRGGLIS